MYKTRIILLLSNNDIFDAIIVGVVGSVVSTIKTWVAYNIFGAEYVRFERQNLWRSWNETYGYWISDHLGIFRVETQGVSFVHEKYLDGRYV